MPATAARAVLRARREARAASLTFAATAACASSCTQMPSPVAIAVLRSSAAAARGPSVSHRAAAMHARTPACASLRRRHDSRAERLSKRRGGTRVQHRALDHAQTDVCDAPSSMRTPTAASPRAGALATLARACATPRSLPPHALPPHALPQHPCASVSVAAVSAAALCATGARSSASTSP